MITANEIKTGGIKAIEEHLENSDRVGITVRGKVKYVIMPVETYDVLQELELDRALAETREDIKNGAFTTSLDKHFEELDKELDS